MKPYKYFSSLHNLYDDNFKLLKKNRLKIEKEAIKWLSGFGYSFGTHNVGCNDDIVYYYTTGSLSFSVKGLGDYTFRFIIQMYHFCNYKTSFFMEGYKYGKRVKSGDKSGKLRDENPYDDFRYYENINWDCGYILGLSDYTIDSFLDLFH